MAFEEESHEEESRCMIPDGASRTATLCGGGVEEGPG